MIQVFVLWPTQQIDLVLNLARLLWAGGCGFSLGSCLKCSSDLQV